jgi:hypothetical protein
MSRTPPHPAHTDSGWVARLPTVTTTGRAEARLLTTVGRGVHPLGLADADDPVTTMDPKTSAMMRLTTTGNLDDDDDAD